MCLIVNCVGVNLPLKAEISNHTLAVLVNENDPESIEIANYYQKVRSIPDSNIIYLNFKPEVDDLSEAEFKRVEKQLKEKLNDKILAYALAWRKPWRVGCMSITSAFSLGFSKEYCAKKCIVTKSVKYFNSQSKQLFTDYKIRPSMLLSANTVQGVKSLIDRGVAADFTRPQGTAYLLSTSDKQRNVRSVYFKAVEEQLDGLLNVDIIEADAIKNKTDIMFYFTGQKKVKWVNKNDYLPGAIADHLTSIGGQLFNGGQMSALEWIDAGVTGTYGSVVEPCNFVQKFPNPGIVIQNYLSGNSLIEAYWKSVQMPGQGLFVGEPLTSPYKNCKLFKNKRGRLQYLVSEPDNLVERKSRNCN